MAKELEMWGHLPADTPFAGRAVYWRHVCAAAKLFAYQATVKQKELMDMTTDEIKKVRDEWNRQTKT